MAATATTCQVVWMRIMLRSLCHEKVKGTTIYCDNSSAIALSKNSVFQKRMKHIDAKYHYTRELVNNGEIVLQHCRTEEKFVDILIKPLGLNTFNYLRKCLGVKDNAGVEIKAECSKY